MKTILSIILTAFSMIHYGQRLEQNAAINSCECISKLKEVTDEKYRECISNSLAKSATEVNAATYLKQISTVDGMKSALKKVDSLVKATCLLENKNNLEKKKDLHYSYSKNESARNAYIIGKDFMKDKKYDLAIESFEIALKNDKNFVLANDDIAVCYRQMNDYDSAIKYYKKSLSIFPEGDFALKNIGVVYTLKSDFKISNEYYQKLINFYPTDAEGYYGLGKNLILLEELEKALLNILKAHKIYLKENSAYAKDAETLESIIYQEMKKKGEEQKFIDIANENGITINFRE